MVSEVGKTQDAGFQYGIRKTFPVQSKIAWDLLFSEQGMRQWFGRGDFGAFELDKIYESREGIIGNVRLIQPDSHIRMSWKKEEWENDSTLQIRIIDKGEQTTISFHHEKLLNEAQRKEMKVFWEKKIQKLNSYLIKESREEE